MKKKSMTCRELPTQQNTQEGIERVFIPHTIESRFLGRSAKCSPFKFISKFGGLALGLGISVQCDVNRPRGRCRERSVTRRRCPKELPIRHLQSEGHAADGQFELLLSSAS
jgi:hypothetical protein